MIEFVCIPLPVRIALRVAMATMQFRKAQMSETLFSHPLGPTKQFDTKAKLSLGCTVCQIRLFVKGYPISVLIWESTYPWGIPLRIAFLCTSRFFQEFDFWIQHTFLHKNTPSNFLASATWLKVLLALGLIILHQVNPLSSRTNMDYSCTSKYFLANHIELRSSKDPVALTWSP